MAAALWIVLPGLSLSSDNGTSDVPLMFRGDAALEQAQPCEWGRWVLLLLGSKCSVAFLRAAACLLPGSAGHHWEALEAGWGGCACGNAGEAKGCFFGRYLAVPGGLPGHGIPRRRR